MIDVKLLRDELVTPDEIRWLHDELSEVQSWDAHEDEKDLLSKELSDLRSDALAACESLRGLLADQSLTETAGGAIREILGELEDACKR